MVRLSEGFQFSRDLWLLRLQSDYYYSFIGNNVSDLLSEVHFPILFAGTKLIQFACE